MILLIDNYDSFTFNVFQCLSGLGAEVDVVRNDRITLEEIEYLQPEGIVLSPGPGRPEDAGICINLIKSVSGSIPIMGICLGHQAIAVAFGGEVVAAGKIVHGKGTMVFHDGQGLYRGLEDGLAAGRYHSLVVAPGSLPCCLEVDALGPAGMIMGLRHKEHSTYGVQFHPESILTPCGAGIFANFLGAIVDKNTAVIANAPALVLEKICHENTTEH